MNVETRPILLLAENELPASIDPHSYECGNSSPAVSNASRSRSLQLSHIHMNVETLEPERLEVGIQQWASIEPHSYECGNEAKG